MAWLSVSAKRRLQHVLGLVLLADDADHLVEIEEGDDHAGEDFEPALDLAQPVARAADQHVAAVVEPLPQGFRQRQHARDDAVDQNVHVHGEARFQLAHAEKAFHHDAGVDVARAGLQHDADVLGEFVAHVGKQRQLALVDQFRELFDQPRFLHAIGNFRHHGVPEAARALLLGPARADAERAAPGAIGFRDGLARIDDHAAGGEIRPRHESDELVGLGLRDWR